MSIQAALWRVLLCISMILNGSALASTSMPMSPPPPPQHQLADRTAVGTESLLSHAACHEQAADMSAAASHAHPPRSPVPHRGGHATPDCCPAGSCACACMPPLPSVAVAGFDSMAMQAMRSGHARVRHDEPVLPHLIRPPIG